MTIWLVAAVICLITGGLFMRMSNRIKLGHGPRTATVIALPVNEVSPSITGTTTEGSTLTGSDGTWTLSPVLTRQWLRNGSPIGGATAGTYLLVSADVGATISFRVTANGTVVATSASVGPVAALPDSPPVMSVAPTAVGQPIVGFDAFVDNTGTYVPPATSFTYRLYNGASPVSLDAFDATFDFHQFQDSEAGDSFKWQLTPYNGGVAGDPVFTNTLGPVAMPNPGPPTLVRTSASGASPLTLTFALDANTYDGYRLHYSEYSDALLTTKIWSGEVVLTNDMMTANAADGLDLETLDLPSNGLPDVGFDTYDAAQTGYPAQVYASAYVYAITPLGALVPASPSASNTVQKTDAAVAVVWNSLDKTVDVVLSDGNRVATIPGAAAYPHMVRANVGVEDGDLRYFEIENTDPVMEFVALANDSAAFAGAGWFSAAFGGTPTTHAISWSYGGGVFHDNTVLTSSAGDWSALGKVTGWYVNRVTDRLYLTLDGVATVGDPVAGTGGIDISVLGSGALKPALNLSAGSANAGRLRAKSADLISTPLGSYLPLDPS